MADLQSDFGPNINLVEFLVSSMFSSKIFIYSGQWNFPRYVLPKMHWNNINTFKNHDETRAEFSNVCLVTVLGGNHFKFNQIIWYSYLIDWFIQTKLAITTLFLSSGKILVFKSRNSIVWVQLSLASYFYLSIFLYWSPNLSNILDPWSNWWISKIDLTCPIHPAKYDYKYISVVAEEISGQHFDMTAMFRILVNKPWK